MDSPNVSRSNVAGYNRPIADAESSHELKTSISKTMPRTRNFVLGAVMLIFAGCQFGDELIAYGAGKPILLKSATGSLDAYDNNGRPLTPFFHVFNESDGLRIVMRDYFYNSGPLARPYLTVNSLGQGVVHIDTKARFALFSTKCEFLRQIEIKVSSADLNEVKSIQVYNHDVEQKQSPVVTLSDRTYMSNLLRESAKQVAMQDISGVGSGC